MGVPTPTTMSLIEEDKKYRMQVYDKLYGLLCIMKNNGVKTREDLKKYIGYFDYNTNIYNQEKAKYVEILINVGWYPLDAYYDDDITRLNAKMILTDESIDLAMKRLLIPYNRDWCYCLAEDYKNNYKEDKYEEDKYEDTIKKQLSV